MTDPSPPPAVEEDLPPRPIRPTQEDCCRSDCPNCVFTLYDRAVEKWEEEVERIRRARGQPG